MRGLGRKRPEGSRFKQWKDNEKILENTSLPSFYMSILFSIWLVIKLSFVQITDLIARLEQMAAADSFHRLSA